MGSGASRPRTPLEILEIECGATLQETKKAYCRLSYKHRNDPDALLRLNDAYAACRAHVPLEIYTPALFDAQFSRHAPDFFSRLELSYNLHPRVGFADGDFTAFYRYWNTFRHEDEAVERKVRSIIRVIKARDPRFVRPAATGAAVCQKPCSPRPKTPHVKTWRMLCTACKKSFNSENTLRDHLRSRQHRERVKEGEDVIVRSPDGEAVNNEKTGDDEKADDNEKTGDDGEAGDDEEASAETFGNEETSTRKDIPEENRRPGSINRTAGRNQREHEAFRTCFYCKKVFEGRGPLILHIRENHQ